MSRSARPPVCRFEQEASFRLPRLPAEQNYLQVYLDLTGPDDPSVHIAETITPPALCCRSSLVSQPETPPLSAPPGHRACGCGLKRCRPALHDRPPPACREPSATVRRGS